MILIHSLSERVSCSHLNYPDAISLLLKAATKLFHLTHEVVVELVDNTSAAVNPWFDQLSICYARVRDMNYRSALNRNWELSNRG